MSNSSQLYHTAQNYIPGGVNSPVRAFRNVGRDPLFIQRGMQAYLYDMDDQRYIDYVGSWGPLILGHVHPGVLTKVIDALQHGFTFGASTSIEVELAKKIQSHMPSLQLMRFVSSGTEAVMSAIRLARGFTKRNKIIKFAGCYHGHVDSLLVAAGSGGLTLGVPDSAGVPEDFAKHTLIVNYNDLDQVTQCFERYAEDIAAIIVEPIAGNMNLVLPQPQFLQGLRDLCTQYQAVLIWDEVITGFRVALGGAQALYGITPDLTILGKIIGGGFPAAAFGGRKEIMQYLAPLGPVYQAGTLSGNPIAMTAGLATLEEVEQPGFYGTLEAKTSQLIAGLKTLAHAANIPFKAESVGSMFGLFFTEASHIHHLDDVKQSNLEQFKQFFHGMLAEGVYLAPSAFEVGFVSAAHTANDIQATLKAAEKVLSPAKE